MRGRIAAEQRRHLYQRDRVIGSRFRPVSRGNPRYRTPAPASGYHPPLMTQHGDGKTGRWLAGGLVIIGLVAAVAGVKFRTLSPRPSPSPPPSQLPTTTPAPAPY
jgi:hypothetical protein